MNTLYETAKNPSGWDSYGNYLGDIPDRDLYVVMTRNRDSDTLTECNWDCAIDMLGGEGETVEIHRFRHWGCGWWEALCVRKSKFMGFSGEKYLIAQKLHNRLEDYPVVNEEWLSEYEMNEANRVWDDCYSWEERIEYIREHRYQFESFEDISDILDCVKGKYFAGYANELIY